MATAQVWSSQKGAEGKTVISEDIHILLWVSGKDISSAAYWFHGLEEGILDLFTSVSLSVKWDNNTHLAGCCCKK